MYSYFYGTIVSINKKSITFDCNGKGYIVNVSHPELFIEGIKTHIYIYGQYIANNKNGFLEDLYGFKEYKEKELFLSLMSCSGIGPKTALNICQNDYNVLIRLISNNDLEGLKKCNGINEKIAHSILEKLKNHYLKTDYQNSKIPIEELFDALNSLGYKQKDIQYAINEINKNNENNFELSFLISKAIKIILNHNNINN